MRRTAIVFDTLELKYERRKLASMELAEFAEIKKINPLGRVPALVLADDEVLIAGQAAFRAAFAATADRNAVPQMWASGAIAIHTGWLR